MNFNFWSKKEKEKISSVFFQFLIHRNPGSVSGSVSGSGFTWRIWIQWIRIYNNGASSLHFKYTSKQAVFRVRMHSLELEPCFSLNLDRPSFRVLMTKKEKFTVENFEKTIQHFKILCISFSFLSGSWFWIRIQYGFATLFFFKRGQSDRSVPSFSLTVFFHEGFVDLVRGADPGSTITAGLEVLGKIFGEDVNKEITKVDL